MGAFAAKAYDTALHLARSVVCRVRGHDDIRVLDGLRPFRVETGNVGLAAKLESAHLFCLRCKRTAPLPPRRR